MHVGARVEEQAALLTAVPRPNLMYYPVPPSDPLLLPRLAQQQSLLRLLHVQLSSFPVLLLLVASGGLVTFEIMHAWMPLLLTFSHCASGAAAFCAAP
jgi:hypothetical protein